MAIRKKRMMVWGASSISVVVVALLVAPGFVDWSKYQSLAQTKLQQATGYDMKIDGAMRIALLPTPHAAVDAVTLSKPGETQPFLTLDSARVSISLLPLLTGHVEIASVSLDKPVLTLVTHKNGTDNWKPATAAQPAATTATAQPAATSETSAPPVSIGGLEVSNGRVVLHDEVTGTVQQVDIDDLKLKADSLTGPFAGNGTLTYGKATVDVDLTTGGYRAGQTLPVQLALKDTDGRADIKWSGVVATGASPEAQGELDMAFTDLAGVLSDAGLAPSMSLPKAKTRLTGMVTARADGVSLTNGALELGKSKLTAKLDVTGLKTGPKSVKAVLDTQDIIDVNSMLDVAGKVVKADKKDTAKTDKKTPAAAGAVAPFVPADFALPADVNADVQLGAKGLQYNGRKTGALGIHASVAGGKGDVRATLADLPQGGDLSFSASMADKGSIDGAVQASVSGLKETLSDWLGLVDAKTFDNPSMPRRIDLAATYKVAGHTAAVTFNPLSLGETKLTGTLAYTAATRPVLDARLAANVLTLPDAAQPAAKKDGKAEPAAASSGAGLKDLSIDAPQLPFDLKFDLSLARLSKGNLVLSDIRAAGRYDGKGVSIDTGSAALNGGTLSVKGNVADLKALSGVDIQAGLSTANLEDFVKGVTGKPLELSKPVGAFSGTLKAKGDRDKMAVDAGAQAWGYTVSAAGNLKDPLSGEIPNALSVRVRHNNFVEAMRAFSPGFGNTGGAAAKPIDLSGQVGISGKVYAITGLKGTLGGSDIAGSLKADMSGAKPSFSADIASTRLDAGALVGVESKKGGASGGSDGVATAASAAAAGAPWSRESLDTGFLNAMDLDVKVKAGTLLYGSWTINDAAADVTLAKGALNVSSLSGKMYDGSFAGALKASASGDKSPLNVAMKADVKDVSVGPFLQALMSSSKKMADGKGSLSLDISGSGTSSAALVGSLAGKADVKATSLVVYGMDLDKLAANMVEAFDGGWKGVLAGVTGDGFSGGSTAFKDVSHSFAISGGDMPVKNFTLQTTSANATLVANGTVSFARWNMDVQSDVKVTQPKDVPVIGLRVSGPLNSPSKSVNSQALDNLLRSKVQAKVEDKVQKLVGDKLKGTAAEGLVNQVLPGILGGGSSSSTTAQPQTQTQQPAAPDATTTPPATQEQQPQATPQQQLLNGLINQLGR